MFVCMCMRIDPSCFCVVNLFNELFPCNGRRSFCLFRGRCLETNYISEPFASDGCFSSSTVLSLSKYSLRKFLVNCILVVVIIIIIIIITNISD
jgi:hypothetical protein